MVHNSAITPSSPSLTGNLPNSWVSLSWSLDSCLASLATSRSQRPCENRPILKQANINPSCWDDGYLWELEARRSSGKGSEKMFLDLGAGSMTGGGNSSASILMACVSPLYVYLCQVSGAVQQATPKHGGLKQSEALLFSHRSIICQGSRRIMYLCLSCCQLGQIQVWALRSPEGSLVPMFCYWRKPSLGLGWNMYKGPP